MAWASGTAGFVCQLLPQRLDHLQMPRYGVILRLILLDADYLAELSRTYNDFFHRYDETPLLIINTSDIDFVENEQDFNELTRAINSIKRGTHYYQPLSSR